MSVCHTEKIRANTARGDTFFPYQCQSAKKADVKGAIAPACRLALDIYGFFCAILCT